MQISGSHLLSSELELGLILIGSVAITILLLLLCTCFKQKKGYVACFVHYITLIN